MTDEEIAKARDIITDANMRPCYLEFGELMHVTTTILPALLDALASERVTTTTRTHLNDTRERYRAEESRAVAAERDLAATKAALAEAVALAELASTGKLLSEEHERLAVLKAQIAEERHDRKVAALKAKVRP